MAKYIQLYQVKKQLNIDESFKDDDEYLVEGSGYNSKYGLCVA